MKITQYKKEFEKHTKKAIGYKLEGDDKTAHEFFQERKDELQLHRKNIGVEEIWKAADKAYQPYNTPVKKKGVFVSNDELGWRSTKQILNSDDDWMEDSIYPNPYIKIQTALGIIVDRNPGATFRPSAKKYVNNNALIEDLYKNTWNTAHSKSALLKPFVFNQAKYGIGVGRTYPLKISRDVDDLVEFNPSGPSKYISTNFTYYDDVFRESLSPWQCWFDDAGSIGNPFSYNDNMWYKDYSWQRFKAVFSQLPNFQYILPSKKVLGLEGNEEPQKEGQLAKFQIRVWFYENLDMDRFITETDEGVVLINEPLPQRPKNKHLSLYSAPWTLRDDKSIYGIGVYESMRGDHKLHTKIRQMTMDQLIQSIYKEFFYEGTDTLQTDGVMKVRPGRGRQVTNPQHIKWNEIPGPGQEAWLALDRQEQKIEEVTGITKGLSGEVVGKTAYETAQARESALKRLKTPLENLTDALERDAYITVSIIEDLYSVPKIKLLGEDRYVDAMELKDMADEMGNLPAIQEEFREMPLNVKMNDEGLFAKTNEENNFVSLRPDNLPWEGVIQIKGESIIADSELLDRTTTLEMANMIIPLLTQPPELVKKPAGEILKVYKKDPKDWLPDMWLEEQKPLFNPIQPEQGQSQEIPTQADTVVPPSDMMGITTPTDSFKQTL